MKTKGCTDRVHRLDITVSHTTGVPFVIERSGRSLCSGKRASTSLEKEAVEFVEVHFHSVNLLL